MLPFENYSDKPQTYVKHFFLERYLERVAYNVYSRWNDFVYIDGFTGPWLSKNEKYEDTSFAIALKKLKNAKGTMYKPGSPKSLRCFFVEKEEGPYEELEEFLTSIKGAKCKPFNGSFEQAIPEIVDFVGNGFSFCFIDPKGFTGYPMHVIQPLLNLRGEVLINFMYNFVNKHMDNSDASTRQQMDDLFGGGDWRDEILSLIAEGSEREDAIVETYCSRLKKTGGFEFVASTRILFGGQDRTYFYLVYGTKHLKGLVEFRNVEKQAVPEQENVRNIFKYREREQRHQSEDLLSQLNAPIEMKKRSFEELRSRNLERAARHIVQLLSSGATKFEDCLEVLELPYVWRSDVQDILEDMRANGVLQLLFEKPRERRPKEGTKLALLS